MLEQDLSPESKIFDAHPGILPWDLEVSDAHPGGGILQQRVQCQSFIAQGTICGIADGRYRYSSRRAKCLCLGGQVFTSLTLRVFN